MIVYGDRQRKIIARHFLDRLSEATQKSFDPERLLIEAGELSQALIDWEFHMRGDLDDLGPLETSTGKLTQELAIQLSYPEKRDPRKVLERLKSLGKLALPNQPLACKTCEGFAFYGLYPSLYLRSAKKLKERLSSESAYVVLGIRSIGTSIAPVVAAGLNRFRDEVARTIRPIGHPFDRSVRIGFKLEKEILKFHQRAIYVIVDEGPGLSGSSLGAVADWLESRTIPSKRIVFLTGHAEELGPKANDRHRKRWSRAIRVTSTVEEMKDNPHLLEILNGKSLSAGHWRLIHFKDQTNHWPPSHLRQERLKFLLQRPNEHFLLAKFLGNDHTGLIKYDKAQRLHRGGFIPVPHSVQNGFLLEDWTKNAHPIPKNRIHWINRVAQYLSFLNEPENYPTRDLRLTTSSELLKMAAFNASNGIGVKLEKKLLNWQNRLDAIEKKRTPVLTDNRMHAWEWLESPSLGILKADALDHCLAHDCIGPQDIHWDLVGALVELELNLEESRYLYSLLHFKVDKELLRFHLDCYLAFQGGYYSQAALENQNTPQESNRLQARSRWYFDQLSSANLEEKIT